MTLKTGAKNFQHQAADRQAPDTGKALDEALLERGLPIAELARRLSRDRSTVASYLSRPSIQTAILWELCHALKHNFFADFAAQLPAEYHSDALAAMEARLEKVTQERDLMARLLSGNRADAGTTG